MADPSAASDPLLVNVALYLGATVVAVPLFKRFGLGSILGYLAAGAVIGPYGFAMFTNVEEVSHVAEFGVVLLLFVIGLELQPGRLWRLRGEIFGLGLTQVMLSGLVLACLMMLVGLSLPAATVVGLALALSSTAFGVQILRENGALTTPYGDRAFSILLFQDIAVVPLLALTAFLGGEAGGMSFQDVLIALAALAALGLVGHYGLKHVFRLLALIGAQEVFAAAALLIVALAALTMQWAGLSMALGAFLAGVLLAETEFRHQVESDIEPFRVLFLGLFFVAVGMSVDWGLAVDNLALVIVGSVILFAIKMLAIYGVARAAGSKVDDALRIGATLGQAGEFGFVVFSLAVADHLIGPEQAALLTATVAVSMALTPIVSRVAEMLIARRAARAEEDGAIPDVTEAPGAASVIIAGFGRTGQVIARIMRLRGYQVTLIDNSPRRIRIARSFGSEVYYGDATKIDVLTTAGADEAALIFYAINDREGAKKAAARIKQRFPRLRA
ncbi:MAG: monovalent cation:proton antiporter-2 (CPA2) family protein, partial [Pseudomonadota bacterium]